jgi:hypothetical protein
MWQKRIVLFLLTGFLTIPSSPQSQENSNFSVSVNLVTVPVSIFDSGGNLITELQKEIVYPIFQTSNSRRIPSIGFQLNIWRLHKRLFIDGATTICQNWNTG